MKTTTLNELNKHNPCGSGKAKLLEYLGKTELDDEELSFITILESNGIKDAIWCLRVLPEYDLDVMTFKLRCARRVEHLDKTGTAKKILDVVENFIKGESTKEELEEYHANYARASRVSFAADVASFAAAAAADAADAVDAAYAAADVASFAAAAAAAADAAYAASFAAAASAAAADAAYAAADAAERQYQTEIFREIFK